MQRLCIRAALSYKTFRSSQIVEGGHLMILVISNQLKKSEKKVCILTTVEHGCIHAKLLNVSEISYFFYIHKAYMRPRLIGTSQGAF